MNKFWFLGATLLVLLSSCSTRVPYSTQLSNDLDLPEDQLKQVQFYVSQTVVLERKSEKVRTYTQNGTVVVKDDQEANRVVIQQGTPGTVVKEEEDKLFVSFEDDPNRFLVFGADDESGRYILLAKSWKNDQGVVNYGGVDYLTSRGSGSSYLLMKMKKEQKMNSTTRYVKGRKL